MCSRYIYYSLFVGTWDSLDPPNGQCTFDVQFLPHCAYTTKRSSYAPEEVPPPPPPPPPTVVFFSNTSGHLSISVAVRFSLRHIYCEFVENRHLYDKLCKRVEILNVFSNIVSFQSHILSQK